MLLSRLKDAVRAAAFGGPRFIGFLDERQRSVLTGALRRQSDVQAVFYGGFPDAQRTLLGIFPVEVPGTEDRFPLRVLRAEFRRQDSLSHRDILGALMGLELKREAVGDIQIGEGRAFFCCPCGTCRFYFTQPDKGGPGWPSPVGGRPGRGTAGAANRGAQWCGRFAAAGLCHRPAVQKKPI